MRAIGGYFGLELCDSGEYHENAIRLNIARSALSIILKNRGYRKIYVPYYTCDVILDPIVKWGGEYEYYSINNSLEIDFNLSVLSSDEAILYTNYFGIKDEYVNELSVLTKNIIIDNAQAFYARPNAAMDTFYSPRKFFGLTDGAYLYGENLKPENLQKDESHERFIHMLKREDLGPQAGYLNYQENEQILSGLPVAYMSNLTHNILKSIDYESVKRRRRNNYLTLAERLASVNQLNLPLSNSAVPLIYPLVHRNGEQIRKELHISEIFAAQYWPNKIIPTDQNVVEKNLKDNLIAIPIDQRYSADEMNLIATKILHLC